MAQFGFATVTPTSQTPVHGPGLCFIEQSAVFIAIDYFDSTRFPYLPVAVQYRVDDLTSGNNIVPWTTIGPQVANLVTVTSPQNALVSLTRCQECHQVLFAITDDEGINYARAVYELIRVPGI
jgi:hypothetical protein